MDITIDKELIQKVAKTARLHLTEDEINEFIPHMEEALDSFSQIIDVDVEGIEPSFQPVSIRNSLREDVITESITQEDALKNATHKKDGYFMGPKAV